MERPYLICAGEKNRSRITKYICSSSTPNLQSVLDPASLVNIAAAFDSSRKQSSLLTSPFSHKKNRHKVGFSYTCAGEKNRTPDHCLEGSCFTTKLHPRASKILPSFAFAVALRAKRLYRRYTREMEKCSVFSKLLLPSAAAEPLGTTAIELGLRLYFARLHF